MIHPTQEQIAQRLILCMILIAMFEQKPSEPSEPNAVWERQSWEDPTAYYWFNQYLLLDPPRALVRLARQAACPWTWSDLETVSHTHGWKARAGAWDEYQANRAREIVETYTEEAAHEIGRRHARTWQKVSKLGDRVLARFERADNHEITLPALIRMLDVATKAERLILGQTTSNEGGGVDYSKLSDDELEQLHALHKKAAG